MADQFEISPPTLRVAGNGIARTANRLDDAVAELRSAMGRLQGCWGGDEPGRAFGDNYEPKGRAMLDHLAGLAGALASVPSGLEQMAGDYERSEASSTIPGGG